MYLALLLPWGGDDNSLSCTLMDVAKCFAKACMAAEAPSAVIIRVPVALQNFGQEGEPYFVPGGARGLAPALQREREATEMEKVSHPRSLKERTVQVFYFQNQQPFLVLFIILFPFPSIGTCCFDPIHCECLGSRTPRSAKHP